MKFGYFCNITNWNHKPYTQVIDEVRDIAMHNECGQGKLTQEGGSAGDASCSSRWPIFFTTGTQNYE